LKLVNIIEKDKIQSKRVCMTNGLKIKNFEIETI
jgi:hypothetical protein